MLELGLLKLCWIIVVSVDTLVLFLILEGMLLVFTSENSVCCRLITYGLYHVEVGSFYAHFLKFFLNHKMMLNFVLFCFYFYFFFIVVGFVIHWNESAMDLHVFPIPIPLPHPSPPDPSRSSQCTRSERLSHASNLGWWSVSP